MKFYIKTFGCRVNQIESESVAEELIKCGIYYDEKNFDILIINSCCVTEKTEKEIIKYIKKSLDLKPFIQIIVTGCFATVFKEKIEEISKNIKIFSNSNKSDIIKTLTGKETNRLFRIEGFKSRTRAFVKVQDGCDLRCSYCIVPIARNEMISKPLSNAVEEINNLVLKGYKEIVLSGTRLGAYDDEGKRLNHLLKKIADIKGNFRIRLSSLEPMEINEELCEICSDSSRFCSYFHIPLQSGSDEVLKKMRRPYNINFFSNKLDLIRKKIKDVGIYSDVIVGFPGESEKDFLNSVNFIKQAELSGLHVFTYSKRPKTESFYMEDLGYEVKKKRSQIMHDLDKELRKNFGLKMIGKNIDSVVIREKKGVFWALTSNFLEISLKNKAEVNARADVTITDFKNGIVYGEL